MLTQHADGMTPTGTVTATLDRSATEGTETVQPDWESAWIDLGGEG